MLCANIISPGSSRIVNGTDAEEGEFPFAVNQYIYQTTAHN